MPAPFPARTVELLPSGLYKENSRNLLFPIPMLPEHLPGPIVVAPQFCLAPPPSRAPAADWRRPGCRQILAKPPPAFTSPPLHGPHLHRARQAPELCPQQQPEPASSSSSSPAPFPRRSGHSGEPHCRPRLFDAARHCSARPAGHRLLCIGSHTLTLLKNKSPQNVIQTILKIHMVVS